MNRSQDEYYKFWIDIPNMVRILQMVNKGHWVNQLDWLDLVNLVDVVDIVNLMDKMVREQ